MYVIDEKEQVVAAWMFVYAKNVNNNHLSRPSWMTLAHSLTVVRALESSLYHSISEFVFSLQHCNSFKEMMLLQMWTLCIMLDMYQNRISCTYNCLRLAFLLWFDVLWCLIFSMSISVQNISTSSSSSCV